jgi:hypothetical protein
MGNPVYIGGKPVDGINSHAGDIYFGQNPDGSQRYIRQGKYATDAFRMFINPDAFFGKMSAPLQALFTLGTKHEPGSGFEAIEQAMTPEQQNQQRLMVASKPFTPFVAEPAVQYLAHKASPEVFRAPGATSQFLGMPAFRGASLDSSVKALRDAIATGREDLVQRVIANAAQNGYNLRSMESQIKKETRKEVRRSQGVPLTQPPPGR